MSVPHSNSSFLVASNKSSSVVIRRFFIKFLFSGVLSNLNLSSSIISYLLSKNPSLRATVTLSALSLFIGNNLGNINLKISLEKLKIFNSPLTKEKHMHLYTHSYLVVQNLNLYDVIFCPKFLAFGKGRMIKTLPSSSILQKTGFHKGMSLGLLIMAAGALLFIPAAGSRSYPLFLTALFIIGTGLALLQTASNPYVTVLGPLESAAKRISIMGICNKIAGIIAIYTLGSIVLKDVDPLKQNF